MCDRVQFRNGSVAIVCGPRRRRPPCVHCGAPSAFECDGPPRSPGRKTCDRPLCFRCSIRVPPDLDFCREHREHAKHAAQQLRLAL